MADSQSNSKVFSVRIVSIDYYMTPPISGHDICYSTFHGGKVNEVPVIRIYGSTPAGQKTCLHIHRALPYLYVPCADIPLLPDQEGDAYTYKVSASLEKALKLKTSAGSTRQHVHGCSLVRARKFYGYHSSEELFVKTYLYHPQDISRAANLLLGGAVLDKSLQPYESHIPFILQFLVDYNLYGMGLLHLSKMKFRHPIPDVSSHKKFNFNGQPTVADTDGDPPSGSPMWTSSMIPSDWMWQPPSELARSSNHVASCPKRQSICELEGDASVDEILNQQFKMYSSLSQTRTDVKMVQSLLPIWEEQQERTGIHEATVPPDPGKPLPEDVMKALSDGVDFEKKFLELCFEPETSSFFTPPGKELRETDIIASASPPGSLCEHGILHEEGTDASLNLLTADEMQSSGMIGISDLKAADKDALNLLKWLATSQAAEDINSDDELVCETILSPLLPSATIDKVLEKANMDYESESQRECRDILDSIDDVQELELLEKRLSSSSGHNHAIVTSSNNMIPQIDGSGDDECSRPCASSAGISSAVEVNHESISASKCHLAHDTDTIMFSKDKKVKKWGSLPFSATQKVENGHLHVKNPVQRETEDSVQFYCLTRNKTGNTSCKMENVGEENSDSNELHTLVCCSVRDLMRRKRYYRGKHVECESGIIKKPLLDRSEKQNGSLGQTWLGLETLQAKEETGVQNHCNIKVDKHDYLVEGNLPSPADSNICLQVSMAKDELLEQPEEDCLEASEVLRNPTDVDSFKIGIGTSLYKPQNSFRTSSADHCKAKGGSTCMKPITSIVCPPKSDPLVDAQLLRTDAEEQVRVPHRDQKSDFSASSNVQYSLAEDESRMLYGQMKSYENAVGTNALDDMHIFQNEKNDNQKPVENVALRDSTCLEPIIDGLDSINTKSTGITRSKKFPMSSNLLLPTDSKSHLYLDEGSNDEMSGNALDDFLPFTERDSHKEMETWDKFVKTCAPHSHAKEVLNFTTHYQNDGSYLYLLTPKILPPSLGSVHEWLFSNERDLMHQETDVKGMVVYECPFGHPLESPLDQDGDTKKKPLSINGGQIKGVKACLDGSQDISQISGPDGKSRSTPLSQTGFRDPASIGCGQQLTLLSIEVLAKSRAELLPDPRFDAINIVAFAFQNDSDPVVEVLVLLHSKNEYRQRSFDGLSGCEVLIFTDEKHLLKEVIKILSSSDPDILMGWDIQGGSLGFLAERASHLGLGLLNSLSRTPSESWVASEHTETFDNNILETAIPDKSSADSCVEKSSIIEDEWGRTHASGVHISGRIVLNVWRLIRGEVKLNLYSVEAVAEAVLRRKIPSIHSKVLTRWFLSGPGRARHQCIKFIAERAKLNLEILSQLDMVNRTSELARVFGIDFFSVLSRGSQYRVESMFLRLAHMQNYLAISPGHQQVASQPAMECLPLVMEPESGFYSDPVIVFDFQSLYPSMIIAYNLCFCTCLGKVAASKSNILGVSSFSPERHVLQDLKDQTLITPNGVMFVPAKVRRGVLPRLLEEILSTRIMVKQAMKKLAPSQLVLQRIFNARQLALKLIANVTYGYTAAGFSGRMPCAELADSIVQCGRSTLEKAISFVNLHEKWNARVIYGDTDSMFVLLKGRTIKEAFQIGGEIVAAINAMNPSPVTLKLEKVYHPCFLLTKKRYVGYSYESPDQIEPFFDAKGIETVRRDTCGAVAKIMEQSLKLFFQNQDLLELKTYLQRQWRRILSGRVSLKDFVLAKEVRLGTYSARTSSLPPAAIVATKAMRVDPRAEPRYAERVPYVVIHGEPGARLVDMVVSPLEVLAIDSPFRINDLYYINKQIIPALQRVFGLLGADLNQWFSEMPRPARESSTKHPFASNMHRTRIDYYYLSKHCILCGELVQASSHLCNQCSENAAAAATAVISKTSKLEQEMQHLVAICHHCGGGDILMENGVKCTSLSCSVFYERVKVQKELLATSHVAADKGFYPRCMIEWF